MKLLSLQFFILLISLSVQKDVIIQVHPVEITQCLEKKSVPLSKEINDLIEAFKNSELLTLIPLGSQLLKDGKQTVTECFESEIEQINQANPEIMDCLFSQLFKFDDLNLYIKLAGALQETDWVKMAVEAVPILADNLKKFASCFDDSKK